MTRPGYYDQALAEDQPPAFPVDGLPVGTTIPGTSGEWFWTNQGDGEWTPIPRRDGTWTAGETAESTVRTSERRQADQDAMFEADRVLLDMGLTYAETYERLTQLKRTDHVTRSLATLQRQALGEKYRRHLRDADRLADRSELPAGVTLSELLAQPDEPQPYRIAELLPVGGRVILSAARKAGKTNFVVNLVRSLVDGVPLLDRFAVGPVAGRVCVIDTEMSPNMLRRWYRDARIGRTDHVLVWPFRGSVAAFDLLDVQARRSIADALRTAGVAVLVLDCLNPVLTALGLDENSNSDVGRFLGAFDALLLEAGIAEATIAHHMGHGPERSRGASKLRDWPDAEWQLLRQRDGDDRDNELDAGDRFFAAYGRDVDVTESKLMFDPVTRQLSIVAGQTRQSHRQDRLVREVVQAVADLQRGGRSPNVKAIKGTVKGKGTVIDDALASAVTQGLLTMTPVGQSHVHAVTPAGDAYLAGGGLAGLVPTGSFNGSEPLNI